MSVTLPLPRTGRAAAEEFVASQLAGLFSGEAKGSERFFGGQKAADQALESFGVGGYAETRNEVWPAPRRGASGLSPYIRHGLLTLREVWSYVSGGPEADVKKFRDELAWQEFARHWYARLGRSTATSMRHDHPGTSVDGGGWDRSLACLNMCMEELEEDGWLVNQSRMWLSSHWTLREGGDWRSGEDAFFSHLLDGSRAANRLGWQWTTAAGSAKPYGFSRWQVEKRAPGLCGQCERSSSCPIEEWPDEPTLVKLEPNPLIRRSLDPTAEAGPAEVAEYETPDVVWLTAESLGRRDPAMTAHPELPVFFVFDEPLLTRLKLDAKRLVFLAETLAEVATDRDVRLFRGRPSEILSGQRPAVTFAPVPGFARIADSLQLGEIHPYPWLARPSGGSVSSFSAWRKLVDL